ncbi:MAG TPA: TonB-dependent receptor [Syntrophales bacterium]|nr:TonB-dependent receptor [Syntrophales bacterium]HOX93521.1 TonB-dependent receptor [Syntrophales bacterium]HPI56010.1 TonB-dependent receptor [Syntrophales bacterium]HPN24100.1 TonB-dependent receptor [Syntrophales bacterium]HQM28379.1 TonB-dependent receptor [Syntrophales bacterium]
MKWGRGVLHAVIFILFILILLHPQAAQAEMWLASLTSAEGGVYVQRGGQTEWTPVKITEKFFPGDTLRVDGESRAALLFNNDSTMRLDQNTTLVFQGMEEETVLMQLLKGSASFFSRIKRSLKMFTPHADAAVKGTEFFARVDSTGTFITLFEGQMLTENERGSLLLSGGQSAMARAGEAPVTVTVVRPRDAVQWALYYPPILDLRPEDFHGDADWQVKARKSVEAYRKGDLAGASSSLKGLPEDAGDLNYHLYRASLLLRVGRVDEANAAIDRSLRLDPQSSPAHALNSIIAVVQNRKDEGIDLAKKAVETDPKSSPALIALSYAQQARFDLKGALASVQEAVKLSPNDAHARARLAEIWLAQGYLDRALEEAGTAAAANPELARTQSVLGYAYLTQVKIDEAKRAFEKAIAFDPADPLPRLGLGLARIRKGDLKEGRQEIEIAASLDVNNAIVRSYLGKAYYEEKRESLSATQFGIAKQLDPMDPTPWFYDAILKQSVNRPVEALQDIQKSIDLNDNRAVYRSRLLLDQDLAARSADLGRIYGNLGFEQLALVEGYKSLSHDPTNFSAHRFLADTLATLPRNEIARVSEVLQAQLLQPININPVQPQLAEGRMNILQGAGPANPSFNEYNPLFNRNQVSLQASSVWGNKNTLGDEVALNAVYDRFSLSLGQFYYKTNGFRENNDLESVIYNLFAQAMLTHRTSVQAELRYTDKEYGDLPLRFDPANYTDTRQDDIVRTARVGLHHAFSPQSDAVVSLRYGKGNFWADSQDYGLNISSEDDQYTGEAQYLFRTDRFRLITGGGYTDLNDTTDMKNIIPGFGTITDRFNSDVHHWNAYLYTYTNYPANVTWTFGVSADFLDDTLNNIDDDQVNPKIGVTWNPFPSTTVRAAAFRALNRALLGNQTIEPTNVAGFTQFFYDIAGTDAWRYGVGIDQKILSNLFAGIELSKRDLDVPYTDVTGPTPEYRTDEWDEEFSRAYLYWAPLNWLALSGEYQYERFKRDDSEGPEAFYKIVTHRFPLTLNFFHSLGFMAQFRGTYVDQEADYLGALFERTEGTDTFWVFDAALGYRLPKRYGIISLEVRNLFNESFNFQDTDPANPRIFPERLILGRITLNF